MKAHLIVRRIRIFMLFEAVTFIVAALAHLGVLVDGYKHREARMAEGVITIVLLAGLVLSLMRPGWTRKAGIAAQGFALLGTLVGVFTIAVGVGPRTVRDIIYHIGIVAVLIWGVVVALRAPVGDMARYA